MRIYLVQQVRKHNQGIIQPFTIGGVEVGKEAGGFLLWQYPGKSILPVPQSGMMGAKVTNYAQMVQK